jgi:hypothetical protein
MADLETYNINLLHQNTAMFFGKQHLPQAQVDPEILNIEYASDMTIPYNQELISLLDLAMIPTPSPAQSGVHDFVVNLFHMLHYTYGRRVACTNKQIPLSICDKYRDAKIDICLLDRHQDNILLVVQDDKRFGDGEKVQSSAEAQLIAKAVATFFWNNRQKWELGQPLLKSQVCAGHLQD